MPTLNWIGKEKVINHHLDIPYHTLNKKYTFNNGKQNSEGDSENKIINADNLLALKSLLPQYEGRIKCIYIDPPYNTGNEGWVYNDNVSDPRFKKWLGQVVGKEAEDLTRHDKWLCMMYPRLKLMHKLLKEDGLIFINIDDNEFHNLVAIMNEIFGVKNKISILVWDLGSGTSAGHFTRAHEYILVYAKNKSSVPNFSGGEGIIDDRAIKKIGIKNPASEFIFKRGTRFDAPDNFELTGEWGGNEKSTLISGRMLCIDGGLAEDVTISAGWTQKKQMTSWFDGKPTVDSKGQEVVEFYFRENGKIYSRKKREKINPQSVLKDIASSKTGSSELLKILGANKFDFPKPSELIKYLIELATNHEDLILDSFAGSGTTAHAVLNLNKQDGGNRKFILIEMENYAEAITAERVKRAINGYEETEGTGGGFSFYTLGETVLDEEGNLNPNLSLSKIHSYIWYSETHQPYTQQATTAGYLGQYNNTGFYFNFQPQQVTTLDDGYLVNIIEPSEQYVIYADMCLLSEKLLLKHNIIFKKIPRDISKL